MSSLYRQCWVNIPKKIPIFSKFGRGTLPGTLHALSHDIGTLRSGFVSYQLQLGDNKLSGGLEALAGCPKLSVLGLAGNKIGELEDLKSLVHDASC